MNLIQPRSPGSSSSSRSSSVMRVGSSWRPGTGLGTRPPACRAAWSRTTSPCRQGGLAGLHYQKPFPQGKLLSSPRRRDLRRRRGYPPRLARFRPMGRRRPIEPEQAQLYVPPGFRTGSAWSVIPPWSRINAPSSIIPRPTGRVIGTIPDRHRLARHGPRRLGQGPSRPPPGRRSHRRPAGVSVNGRVSRAAESRPPVRGHRDNRPLPWR